MEKKKAYETSVPSTHPLRSNSFGHKVKLVHGAHPLADGGTCFGDFGDSGRLEFIAVDVRLDLSDDSLWDVVSIIFE